MGAAAIPIMIATTVASGAAQIYSGIQQSKFQQAEADRRARQAQAQAKDQEIERLSIFNRDFSENAAKQAASGFQTGSGTLDQIQQGNINNMKEDVEMIQLTGEARAQSAREQGRMAKRQGRINTFVNVLNTASQVGMQANSVNNTKTPNGSGVV